NPLRRVSASANQRLIFRICPLSDSNTFSSSTFLFVVAEKVSGAIYLDKLATMNARMIHSTHFHGNGTASRTSLIGSVTKWTVVGGRCDDQANSRHVIRARPQRNWLPVCGEQRLPILVGGHVGVPRLGGRVLGLVVLAHHQAEVGRSRTAEHVQRAAAGIG